MPEYLSKNLKVLQYDLILSQVSDERHLLQNKMVLESIFFCFHFRSYEPFTAFYLFVPYKLYCFVENRII